MKMNKKGQLGTFQGAVVGLIVTTIVIVIGLSILDTLRLSNVTGSCNVTDGSGCNAAYNSTLSSMSAIGQFPTYFSIIVLVIVAAVIFALLRGFGGAGNQ